MKKICKILFAFFLVFLFAFSFTSSISAKSLANYRQELEELKEQKKVNDSAQQLTQEQINKINAEIDSVSASIAAAEKEIENKKEEIKELEREIKTKEEQIKDLVVFLQVSNGENFYLKYLFGAENFTDLIYRISVIEQLTTRNDELVDEMTALIEQNKLKIAELEQKQKDLAELYKTLNDKIYSLGSKLNTYVLDAISIDDQIKAMEELIAFYVKEGCSETQDVSKCSTSVPYDYGFDKPLKTGYVSDEYGMRWHPTKHKWLKHNGIDLAAAEGRDIYAPAAGKVAAIFWRTSCGGNQLLINHVVNGKKYTTHYMHLLSINVKVGDIVTKGQKIAKVGGGSTSSARGGYDNCTTGAHLHFQMATGHYFDDNYYTGRTFNPRDVIWFPDYGVYW